jgi:hypothetical protein
MPVPILSLSDLRQYRLMFLPQKSGRRLVNDILADATAQLQEVF